MKIPIILGTAREGRFSEKVANYILPLVKAGGIESEILDVRDYRLTATDNSGEIPQAKKLAEKIASAGALIIIMPEYNHTYPGELKMMLDLLYKEYFGKKVGLCGVSAGPLGGARGIQALKLTLLALGMQPVLETVYFSNVQQLFDDKGKIKDPSYEKRVKGLIAALAK